MFLNWNGMHIEAHLNTVVARSLGHMLSFSGALKEWPFYLCLPMYSQPRPICPNCMLRIHLAPHAWSITCVCKLLAPTVRPQTVIAVLCANVYSVESAGRCAFTGAHDRLMDGVISVAVRVCARNLCLFGIYMNARGPFQAGMRFNKQCY